MGKSNKNKNIYERIFIRTRIFKNISAIVAIALIISVIAIPAFAAVNALSCTSSWEATDSHDEFLCWVIASYSGGNGNRVNLTAYAVSNLNYVSVLNKYSTASSNSFTGTKVEYELDIPFVIDHGAIVGYAN